MHIANHSCKLTHTLERFYTTMSKKTLYLILLPPSKGFLSDYQGTKLCYKMFSKNYTNFHKFIESMYHYN